MTTTRARLIIILKADETTVAEVENPALWQQVLAAIHANETSQIDIAKEPPPQLPLLKPEQGGAEPASPIRRFAKTTTVSEQELIGALDPQNEPPYLHLDVHCWEAMKKQTAKRGPGAVSPAALAGTLLCLWFKEAGLGHPTQAQAVDVLSTIGISDRNASRGVRSAKWLQARSGGTIVLNPAQISKAIEIAKSFCTKKWSQGVDVREGTGEK